MKLSPTCCARTGRFETTTSHSVIDKTQTYVKGHVHTNGLENLWSLLKRGLRGTYIAVDAFHLHRYVDEQVFRYNERRDASGDSGRFVKALRSIVGKRLTYRDLTSDPGLAMEASLQGDDAIGRIRGLLDDAG